MGVNKEHAAVSLAESPVTTTVPALAEQVRRAGHGQEDLSAVAVHLRRQQP
jgi:3-hydroxyisobutyrate dehydrogenase-like beta-hydroxyacid dehydrogenase